MNRTEYIVQRYGQVKSLAIVAGELGLSRERVRQILKRASVDTTKPQAARPKATEPKPIGRPPHPDGVKHRGLLLRDTDMSFFRMMGNGNASEGARRTVDQVKGLDADEQDAEQVATG